MVPLKGLRVATLLVLVTCGIGAPGQNTSTDKTAWVKDLSEVANATHRTEKFSNTVGRRLAFADSKHLVLTFISSEKIMPPKREGGSNSPSLHLHTIVFESKTGEVDTERDWLTPNPNDGVIAGHGGKVIFRAGDKLTLFDTDLAALKEIDAADQEMKRHVFSVFSSPSGRFLLVQFSPSSSVDYKWIDADGLKTLYSFSAGLFASTISDKEIIGWRQNSSRQPEIVIRKPDDAERVINLPSYHPTSTLAFINDNTFAIESGYAPMPLVRTDGTAIKSIAPPTHDYFSRITSSAEGHRFAFTSSRIRNTSEILSPHQTWEYVQRVCVYDMSTDTLVGEIKVSHSGRNDDFPLALSSNGSMLAFIDGESLKVYRLPPASEPTPE
jgi:hypothetical protein